MTYLKVWDNVSKIDRVVTQKAFDIVNRNKRKPRYEFKYYSDGEGNPLSEQLEAPATETVQKKTESVVAAPVGGEVITGDLDAPGSLEGVQIIRRKPGPKPKIKNAE